MDKVGRRGFTLWFTGLPCSGKTSISEAVATKLKMLDYRVEHLDGDIIRKELSRDLSFSRNDRAKNVEQVAFIASLLSRNGVITLVSLVSPYLQMRDNARRRIGEFIEVYVRCPLEICERRDVKGMYKLAREGKISNFTGISDPYEAPVAAEIILDTDLMGLQASVDKLMNYLHEQHYLPLEFAKKMHG